MLPRWRLEPGRAYHIEVWFWVPSLVALGAVVISLLVVLGYFLRYRLLGQTKPVAHPWRRVGSLQTFSPKLRSAWLNRPIDLKTRRHETDQFCCHLRHCPWPWCCLVSKILKPVIIHIVKGVDVEAPPVCGADHSHGHWCGVCLGI